MQSTAHLHHFERSRICINTNIRPQPNSPTQTMASNLSLKLVLNKNTCEVLFGEAGKDFIDFLFTLLALPMGYVSKVLTKQHMVGCTGNLYNSLENLSFDYMQLNFDKNTLLNPKMSIPMSGVASGSDGGGGCVKGVVTYMVMDDLVVAPMASVSSISLLNKYQVRDVSVLKEKVVEVGIDEGLALLKASLESKTVLTDVFGEKSEKEPGLTPIKSSPVSSKTTFVGGFQVKFEPMV
ncbi:uncharacterized protein LOC131243599 [Magnolia sinica]|uniref:uncharacterized protein LOC131243599 n=1 Tax=Magnolia sinica TaxID=86752 RepID=UPI002659E299|nr:uncharacterized protein LOC131243599 [Magnolia sinica]